jgi:integral membrane protein
MSIIFAFASASLVIIGALSIRMLRTVVIDELLSSEKADGSSVKKNVGPFTRLVDSVGKVSQGFLFNLYGSDRMKKLSWQLRVAGQQNAGLTAQVFVQREAGFALLGIVLTILAVLNGQVMIGVLTGILFAVWMHVWLYYTMRRRQEQVERNLPDFLDVFAVTVSAGLPFRAALQRVAEFHDGPLAEEMRATLREMQLGVPRRAALEGLRERNQSASMAAFVTILLQSEELGTPLEQALKQIAREIRRNRSQQVRQAAAKAQPKVSIVVTLLIVPGAIILVAGGMFLTNMDSMQGMFNG